MAAIPTLVVRNSRPRRIVATCLGVLACLMAWPAPLVGAGYDELRSAAVARCEAIDPSASQSGLAFNPDGYRSYYVRSECMQRTAVLFRDDTLCDQVRERRTLLWSSWGYSPARCRELVRKGRDDDGRELQEMKNRYASGAMKMTDFRVERNGNGRDFDIIPTFAGSFAHGYETRFEILDPDAANAPVVLYASGHYVDPTSTLRLYVPQIDLRQRFPGLRLNRPYAVRASVRLDVGNGGPSGYWSDSFIEQIFPLRERTQSITRQVIF